MSGNETIVISTDALKDSAVNLRQLNADWSAETAGTVTVDSFKTSKGNGAQRLNEYALLTHNVADTLQDLTESTRLYFIQVSDNFGMADMSAAVMFEKK